MNKLADIFPATIRKVIYTVLGTAVALEAIFDVVEDGIEGKILAALTVLGFTMAVGNVAPKDEPGGDPPQDEGLALIELLVGGCILILIAWFLFR